MNPRHTSTAKDMNPRHTTTPLSLITHIESDLTARMESIASGEVSRACVHAGRRASKLGREVRADLKLKRGDNSGRPTARPDSRLQAMYKNKHGYEGLVKAVADAVKGGAKANVLLLKSEDPLRALKEWTPHPYRLTVTIRGNKMVLRIQKKRCRSHPGSPCKDSQQSRSLLRNKRLQFDQL